MDWFPLFLLPSVALVVGLATGYGYGHRRGLAEGQAQLPTSEAVYQELGDLRHIVAQLKHPDDKPHEHVWPREPDARKLGWLRYKCVVSGCPALRWVPK